MKKKETKMHDYQFKKVIRCPNCNREEYFGLLHWRDGKLYCRICIERFWQDEQKTNKSMFKHYFPYYADGKDYRDEKSK